MRYFLISEDHLKEYEAESIKLDVALEIVQKYKDAMYRSFHSFEEEEEDMPENFLCQESLDESMEYKKAELPNFENWDDLEYFVSQTDEYSYNPFTDNSVHTAWKKYNAESM